ncbi:Rv0361 family membrane protein [Nocardioides dongxiaopingii]|uniref:Rv0361 family membrane protein n=1 Tax=Nocardioides sp. S-1144 TaxID=2582905 RepID=UPI001651DF1A|nr:DUF4878 domain-containing protein [Nocardioides sp. S-1144]
MNNTPPPGWYDDGQGGQRWWDGGQWAAPGEAPSAPASPPPSGPPPSGPPPSGPPPSGYPGQQPGHGPTEQGYGQYGTQADHAQPYPGGGQPRKKKTGLILGIVGAVVALAVVAVVLILVLTGGDDDNGGGGGQDADPADTVQEFIDALKDDDCDAAAALTTGDAAEDVEECETEGTEAFDDIDFEVGESDVDGDTATVPVTVTSSGFEETASFELEKVDGDWLISSLDGDGEEPTADAPSAGSVTPDLPSDVPTDLPTDLPSDFLSDLPSDFPSEFLSEFPTDFPTDFLTDLPTDFPTDFPTE